VTAWTLARRRYRWLDHLARAAARYDQSDGGRLAAAVTYYAFYATFALALLAFAALGFVIDDPVVLRSVQRYLAENLPRIDVQALRDARGTVGVIGFIGLPISGWFWVNALRSSMRAIWRLPEYPGTFLVRVFVDLLVLVGLGLLLATSLAVMFASTAAASRLVTAAGAGATQARWLLGALRLVLGGGINTLLSIAVLTALPRLRMPLRRVVGPALFVAGGLEMLKTLGQLYVQRVEANAAYVVVAGAVGLLVFLNIVNQLILFAATLAATSTPARSRTWPRLAYATPANGRAPSDRPSRYRYWPGVAVSVLDTRTDTTLARLTTTPFSRASRSYLARVKTRLRRSSRARAIASNASASPAKSALIKETSSPPTG
jgi:membrane protein